MNITSFQPCKKDILKGTEEITMLFNLGEPSKRKACNKTTAYHGYETSNE